MPDIEKAGGFTEKESEFSRRENSRYITLRSAEYGGELDREGIKEVLSFEFKNHLKNNPPLEKEFSPKDELRRITKLPRKEKREALERFKEDLAAQKKGWAVCRNFIERSIECDHDIPREDLLDWVDRFGESYGFTSEQKKRAVDVIDTYYKRREAALDLRERIPNDRRLIKRLTGVELPDSVDVTVEVGPMSIDIVLPEDYYNVIAKKRGKKDVEHTEGLSYTAKYQEQPLYFNLIKKKEDHSDVLIHEREHSKNKILREFFERPIDGIHVDLFLEQAKRAEDKDLQKVFLKIFFRHGYLEKGLMTAKDEILAHAKIGGRLDVEMFLEGTYDYFSKLKESRNKEVREAAREVLVGEYKKILEKAIEAFKELKREGYDDDRIIALLGSDPLKDWPKTVKRLLKE